VTEASWVDLSATSGSGNAGRFKLETPNSTFVDTGTFANSGTFEDARPASPKCSWSGILSTPGAWWPPVAASGPQACFQPDVPEVHVVDEGTVEVQPGPGFFLREHFCARARRHIDDRGTFGIANESSFDIEAVR